MQIVASAVRFIGLDKGGFAFVANLDLESLLQHSLGIDRSIDLVFNQQYGWQNRLTARRNFVYGVAGEVTPTRVV